MLLVSANDLVGLLADGEYHSGTSLGKSLGMSRAAVWKQLRKLEEEGLPLESVKGKGYRIVSGASLIRPAVVLTSLSDEVRQHISEIQHSLVTESTNTDAFQAVQRGNQHGLVVTAESQTAGRGRRGRSWVSPFASNLYFSCVWGFEGGAAALEGLSLVVGVSIAKALEQQGVTDVQLKWPNDVWVGGEKIAGILLEMSGDASGFCQVVIGVGLNVSMSSDKAEGIEQAWTSLAQHIGIVDRSRLFAVLLDQLVKDLLLFSVAGFSADFRAQWAKYDVCADKEVELTTLKASQHGVAKGVDESGALLLLVDDELIAVHAGEISLRIKEV